MSNPLLRDSFAGLVCGHPPSQHVRVHSGEGELGGHYRALCDEPVPQHGCQGHLQQLRNVCPSLKGLGLVQYIFPRHWINVSVIHCTLRLVHWCQVLAMVRIMWCMVYIIYIRIRNHCCNYRRKQLPLSPFSKRFLWCLKLWRAEWGLSPWKRVWIKAFVSNFKKYLHHTPL